MKPATVQGFYVDIDQTLYVSDVVEWCDKRSSTWRVALMLDMPPPPKPRLMSFASGTTNYAERCPWDWQDEEQMDNRKRGTDFDFELDWGKT